MIAPRAVFSCEQLYVSQLVLSAKWVMAFWWMTHPMAPAASLWHYILPLSLCRRNYLYNDLTLSLSLLCPFAQLDVKRF